ncbi:MAG: ATP-binding protein [Phycisphaerales bacterium]
MNNPPTPANPRPAGRIPMYSALLLAFIVLLGTMFTLSYQSYNREQADRLARSAQSMRSAMNETLEQKSQSLLALLSLLTKQETLIDAMTRADRQDLLRLGTPMFDDLSSRANITHFYFHTPQGANFLRLHEPDHHGDPINRFTMRRAMETDQPAIGNEPGPFGRFTLRAVVPWKADGRLLGYLELGIEYEDIVEEVAKAQDLQMIVAVNKSVLVPELWENAVARESQQRGVPPLARWDDYTDVAIVFSSTATVPPEADRFLDLGCTGIHTSELVHRDDGRSIQIICDTVPDILGNNAASLIVLRDVTEDIRATQRHLILDGVISSAICALLLLAFLLAFERIHRLLNRQTARLREAYEQLQRSTDEHESLQRKLVIASREAGMAEVATGVLHNVGNVLNSVNVSASVIADQLRHSEVPALIQAGELIRQHAHDLPRYLTQDPRGSTLPAFLQELGRCLSAEHDTLKQEMTSLSAGIDHIKSIVSTQQILARKRTVLEPADPADVLESALELQQDAFLRNNVTINRDYDQLPAVPLDKHRILQILTNLISNAKQALAESDRPDKRLTLRVSSIHDDATPAIRFEVRDNGSGIAPEHHDRLFRHGFTTKSSGHGFGLPSAAAAAQVMGGSLTVQSDGPGKGASFVLTIPVETAEQSPENASSATHSSPGQAA